MKNVFRFLSAALFAAAATVRAQEAAEPAASPEPAAEEASAGTFSLPERELVRELAAGLTAALRESAVPADAPLAILPVVDDREDFAYGLFKIAATDAGRNCVEGRDDPMWETIVDETAWTQRKGSVGVLDPETLTAFGKLQAANLLLYGNIRTERVFFGLLSRVEAELHVSSVRTKQHLWGRSFVAQEPVPWRLIAIAAAVLLVLFVLFLRATTRVR